MFACYWFSFGVIAKANYIQKVYKIVTILTPAESIIWI